MTALLRYDAACQALAEARGLDEVKDVRDKAEALRLYARQAKNHDLEVDAAEIRLRAERRLGEMIVAQKADTGLHEGGRPKTGSENEPVSKPRLADIGVDKKLSSRAQRLAAVPEAKFEAEVATWRERVSQENERVTTTLLREGEKAQKREERRQPVEAAGTIDDLRGLIDGGYRFGCIYADPPWDYETWSDRGADRSPSQHYDVMSPAEIAALPVAQLASDDCILHLWTISTLLPEALQILGVWGFTYKKIGFIWTKTFADGSARKMGNGKWTRDEAEVCLLATRGKPERLHAGVRQTLDAPLGAHSEKPNEIRERITRLTGGPYLELFGRKEVPGWTVWGNQVAWRAPTKAATNIPEIIPRVAERVEIIAPGDTIEQILEHELEAAGPAMAPVDTATSPDIAGEDDRRKVVMAGDFQTQVAPTSADLDIPTFLRRGHPDCFVKAPG